MSLREATGTRASASSVPVARDGLDELRVLRRRDWAAVGIVAAVAVGIALRFLSRGPLWLDEAQSVAIARQPLAHLQEALRHDGAPPLYYALLHGWMKLFGTSTFAVRSLSALPAVLSLPVILRLGRRVGGEAVGIAAVVLLAVSPFAVRYSVETRMYSLLLLLGLLGAHAVLSVHRHHSRRARRFKRWRRKSFCTHNRGYSTNGSFGRHRSIGSGFSRSRLVYPNCSGCGARYF